MRKIFIAALLMVVLCGLSCGCVSATIKHEAPAATFTSWNENVDVTAAAHMEPYSRPEYDGNVNYMAIMIQSAARGDTDALESAVTARNAKIIDLHLGEQLLTVQEFLSNFEQYAGFSLDVDYTAELMDCCVAGDIEAGRAAEVCRNLKIDATGTDDKFVSFDDLYIVSKIITNEAGCYWLPMEWKMAVGEVLLNRVASPEFPDTIEECVYQPGQYSGANSSWFQSRMPFEDCVEAAFRLLSGERVLNEPSAVFQSNGKQGSGVCLELYDQTMGYTYICYSSHPELYE